MLGMKKSKTLSTRLNTSTSVKKNPVTFEDYASQGLVQSVLFKAILLPTRASLRLSKEAYKRLLALKRAHNKLEEEQEQATARSLL